MEFVPTFEPKYFTDEDREALAYPIPYISETTQTGKVVILFPEALDVFTPEIDLKTILAMGWPSLNYNTNHLGLQSIFDMIEVL